MSWGNWMTIGVCLACGGAIVLAAWMDRIALGSDAGRACDGNCGGRQLRRQVKVRHLQPLLPELERQFVQSIRLALLERYVPPIERTPAQIRERAAVIAGALNCSRSQIYFQMESALRHGDPLAVVWREGMLSRERRSTDVDTET